MNRFTELIKQYRIQTIVMFVFIVIIGLISWRLTSINSQAKEPIPYGFTYSTMLKNGQVDSFTITETEKLRILYNPAMIVLQNKNNPDDTRMLSNGNWYLRARDHESRITVQVMGAGNTLIAKFDDVISVSNDTQFCTKGQYPTNPDCRAPGIVYLLTEEKKIWTIETTARQYIVLNP